MKGKRKYWEWNKINSCHQAIWGEVSKKEAKERNRNKAVCYKQNSGKGNKPRFFTNLLPVENELHITLNTFNDGRKDWFKPHWLEKEVNQVSQDISLPCSAAKVTVFQAWTWKGTPQELMMDRNSICYCLQNPIPTTGTFGSGREIAKQPEGIILLPSHTEFKVPRDKMKTSKGYESGSI